MSIPSRLQANVEQAGNPLFLGGCMGRKSTQSDNRARRYIRILDEDKWSQIDKLSTLEKYGNSFNQLINDALDFGLPLLIKAEFGEIDEEIEEKIYSTVHSKDEEFYGQVVRLMKEMIMNQVITKAIVSSLFEAKSLELNHRPVSGEAFKTGCFQDTPEFAEDYELRTLRSLKN